MTTLIVEDNPLDARMIRYAIEKEEWSTDVIVVDDGEKAFQYLQGESPYDDSPAADFVILDLNLPKRSGAEILQLLRTTAKFARVPVAVVSSSPEDVIRNVVDRTRLRAELFLTKPSDVGEYLKMGKSLRICYEEHRNRSNPADPSFTS